MERIGAGAIDESELARLIVSVIGLAEQAGRAISAIYARSSDIAATKADGSPITAADRAADAILHVGLAELTPDWPVVSEERADAYALQLFDRPTWLVDPLDGTREFLDRNGEFAVSIGLIVGKAPRLGVIHGPVDAITSWGVVGQGAWRRLASGRAERTYCRPVPDAGAVAAVSRRHGSDEALDAYLASLDVAERRPCGSALKFCLIAAGEADVYPRFGPTSEWDTAGGHAIVTAAGGAVTLPDGGPLTYGKPGLRNPDFVARGACAKPKG